MATIKKGILTKSPEWWKHLRWQKGKFWRRERKKANRLARKEAARYRLLGANYRGFPEGYYEAITGEGAVVHP